MILLLEQKWFSWSWLLLLCLPECGECCSILCRLSPFPVQKCSQLNCNSWTDSTLGHSWGRTETSFKIQFTQLGNWISWESYLLLLFELIFIQLPLYNGNPVFFWKSDDVIIEQSTPQFYILSYLPFQVDMMILGFAQLKLEGTSGDHLVQPLCSSGATCSQLLEDRGWRGERSNSFSSQVWGKVHLLSFILVLAESSHTYV